MSNRWEKPRKRSNKPKEQKESEKHLTTKIKEKLKSLRLFKRRMAHQGIDDRVAEELWKQDQQGENKPTTVTKHVVPSPVTHETGTSKKRRSGDLHGETEDNTLRGSDNKS